MTFSDFSKTLIPFTFDKEIILSNLDILESLNIFRGGSNLFSSLEDAIRYLSKTSVNKKPSGNILILTDGDIHDFKKIIDIPKGVRVANVSFVSPLGSSVPSFDLDGNYKEPLSYKGKRVHSSINRTVLNKNGKMILKILIVGFGSLELF